MTAGLENAGEAVTGALMAHTIDPGAGEAREKVSTCLNCGKAFSENYCNRCGQPAHIHRTLRSLWHDLAHGVLHFEGKIWRTLPMLIFKPGHLTRRYVAGERARFVSPLALFLFSVFMMFAVFGTVGMGGWTANGGKNVGMEVRADQKDKQRAKDRAAELSRQLNEIDLKLVDARTNGRSTEDLEAKRGMLRENLRLIERGGGQSILAEIFSGFIDGGSEEGTKLAKKLGNTDLLFYKLQSNGYKFSWALIPISIPFVWLLFAFNRRHRVYDHAIFVIYSLSFVSLLFIAVTLVSLATPIAAIAAFLFWFGIPVHMFAQLKGAYGLTVWGALWRTLLLLLFASMSLSVFFSLLLLLGFLG